MIQAGKTPLQVAEEKKYSEIVSLLMTRVPAPGEGEKEGGSEKSSSETEGDQGTCSCVCNKIIMPTKLFLSYRLYVHVNCYPGYYCCIVGY